MNKDLWQFKREFLEYCEIEKGQSLLTISNYERYLNRFLVWLDHAKQSQSSNFKSKNYNLKIAKQDHKTTKEVDKEFVYSQDLPAPRSFSEVGNVRSRDDDKLAPSDIDRETIRKYRLYVNRLYDKGGKELKSTTQNHHILALRAFLRYLSIQGIKTVSPDEIVLAKTGERKVNFLNAEEYRRLLDAPQKSPRDSAIMELLFSTGMRVSELAMLNVGEINFERGEIAVLGKGKKVRVVFVSEQAIKTLAEYLVQRGVLQVITKPKLQMSNKIPALPAGRQNPNVGISDKPKYQVPDTLKKQPLFLSSLGNRMNVRGIERLVQKYAKVAGISKSVSPHTLRHTFATDLLIAGADIRSVQSLLGHSNISTTQVYTHVTDQHLRDIHKKYHNIHNSTTQIETQIETDNLQNTD